MPSRRAGSQPRLDLFMFLSVMVCTAGVLAVLTASPLLGSARVSLKLDLSGTARQTYVIECHPARVVLRPLPSPGAKPPPAKVSLPLERRREAQRAIEQVFAQVRELNTANAMGEQSRQHAVVAAIYPGGEGCYEIFSRVQRSSAGYGVEFGAEPMATRMVIVDEAAR